MGKAFDYILNHWNALNEFCRDGQVEIDNNIGENALRSVAVGRKDYLFFGSDKGGESAAHLQSAGYLQAERSGAGGLVARSDREAQ